MLTADGRVRVAHRGGRASAAVLLVGRLRWCLISSHRDTERVGERFAV